MVLPLIAAGVGVVGAIVKGISASQQLKAAGAQAKAAAKAQARGYIRNSRYQAKDILRSSEVAAKNFLTQAAIHERQAGLIRVKGSYDAARMTDAAARMLGGQVAAFASSGVAVSGTIAEVVRSSGETAAMDIAAARYSSSVSWQNEIIQQRVNRRNAKQTLKYGKEAAKDSIKFGEQAAKDAMKYGASAAAATRAAMPLAIAAPAIAGLGELANSGIFNDG